MLPLCREKGQITVFLSIIVMAVIVLAGVLVDGARIVTAEAQIRRAVASAARSALADYDSRLKEEYGIFALNDIKSNGIENTVTNYLKKNLMIEGAYDGTGASDRYPDLYGYEIENVNAVPLFNLTENEIVRGQVLEYMKYRAPVEVAEGIWEKLSCVNEAAKMSEAYKKRTDIDRLLGKMDKYQERLSKSIYGDGKDKYYVNNFNRDGIRDRLATEYAEKLGQRYTLTNELGRIQNRINELESSGEKAGNEALELEILYKNEMEVEKETVGVKDAMERIWSELCSEQTEAFIKPNREAEKSITEIIRLGDEAGSLIDELEEYIDSNLGDPDQFESDFRTACKDDIKKLREITLEGEKAAGIKTAVASNFSWLSNEVEKLEKVKADFVSLKVSELSIDQLSGILKDSVEGYDNQITYEYGKVKKSETKDDPRKGKAELVREELRKNDSGDRNIEKAGLEMNELPSNKKVESVSFDIEDASYAEDEEKKYRTDVNEYGGVGYTGNLNELDEDIDFLDEDGSFSTDSFKFLSSMGSVFGKGLTDLRDNIYLNEFIMSSFKNSVPELKDDGKGESIDFTGGGPGSRDTFFESEVEYILNGQVSENVNKTMTEAQILLIRFGMNTLQVYSDTAKRELAASLAATLAGWWTGGAGIPILSNLIMCSWGMGEAVIDLRSLMKGESVPFYKTKEDWKLDIGLPKQESEGSNPALLFSYHDYLRLLLMLKSSEEKINRIEDLIELNIQGTNGSFKMSGCNTCVRIEADVSIRYLFWTSFFMPAAVKTENGRHLFKVVLYENY